MRYCSLILVILVFLGCSRERHNFSIEVQVKDTDGKLMYLALRTISGTAVVDSVTPDKKGNYILKGYASQPDFYVIYTNPRNYINVVIHPGDDFRILTHASSFDSEYLVEGSKDSRLIQTMIKSQIRTLEKITMLSELYENSIGKPDFEKVKAHIDSTYNQVFEEHKKLSLDIIYENPGSLVSLMALYQQLGRNTPVFDYKKDFAVYQKVDSSLSRLYPNSEAVMDLNRKLTELKDVLKLEIGSDAPEIVLPDSTGNNISLSSLKGKYVLLLFWASWSDASMNDLNSYISLYPLASKKNIEYFQVSLDKTKDSWIKLLPSKSSKGIHVCDFKYWDSPAAITYHVHTLPFACIINDKGKIERKDINPQQFKEYLDGNK